MKYTEFYDDVYKQDNKDDKPFGSIQWKGTDVCIDLHCECGYHGHFDGEFFYYYDCPKCHKKYAVGRVVKLIPLTDNQIDFLDKGNGIFHTCDLDDDEVN